mmetsp:Transcript_14183/g.29824  ORF Transcript_14183/g.29824 Transcript_14183/m.29824 type:complete len:235 (+) Transcript_14183:84-788(+)
MKNSKITFRGLLSLFRKESGRVHPSGDANSDDSVSSEQLQNDAVDFEVDIFRMPRKISNLNRDRPSDPGSEISQDICLLDFSRDKNVTSNEDALELLVAELGELLMSDSVAADAIEDTPDSDQSSNGANEIECAPHKMMSQEVTVTGLHEDTRRSFELVDFFDELLLGIRDSLSLARKRVVSKLDCKNVGVDYYSDADGGELCFDGFEEHILDELLLSGRRDSVDIALRRREKK